MHFTILKGTVWGTWGLILEERAATAQLTQTMVDIWQHSLRDIFMLVIFIICKTLFVERLWCRKTSSMSSESALPLKGFCVVKGYRGYLQTTRWFDWTMKRFQKIHQFSPEMFLFRNNRLRSLLVAILFKLLSFFSLKTLHIHLKCPLCF